MGLFDALLGGKKKLKGPAPIRLFELSTAYVTLDTSHGIKSNGGAAIMFQSLATADFESIVAEMEELLAGTGADTGTTIETVEDEHEYRWMILRDDDIEDLVVGVHAVSDALEVGGYGDRVLAAVFALTDSKGRPVYLIYNYKRGYWYPFVPASPTAKERDGERELQIKGMISSELSIEPELERWFPLWGIPEGVSRVRENTFDDAAAIPSSSRAPYAIQQAVEATAHAYRDRLRTILEAQDGERWLDALNERRRADMRRASRPDPTPYQSLEPRAVLNTLAFDEAGLLLISPDAVSKAKQLSGLVTVAHHPNPDLSLTDDDGDRAWRLYSEITGQPPPADRL